MDYNFYYYDFNKNKKIEYYRKWKINYLSFPILKISLSINSKNKREIQFYKKITN